VGGGGGGGGGARVTVHTVQQVEYLCVCGSFVIVHTVQEAKYHSVAAHLPLLLSEYLATMVRENFLSLSLDDKVYFQRQKCQIRSL